MRDSHFDNLRTAYASIARLREALMEAREHIVDATPEETRAKIDAALQAAPVTSGQVGGWPAAPAQPKPTRPRSGSPIASTGLSGRRALAVLGHELDAVIRRGAKGTSSHVVPICPGRQGPSQPQTQRLGRDR